MTRFGVMKHLKQLEEAGLVVTRRRGREKLHFLNPVPIRLVHDRWVSKYAEPWAAGAQRPQARDWRAPWRRCSRSTSARPPSGSGRRSPTPRSAASTTSAPASTPTGRRARASRWARPNAGGLLGEGEILEVDPPRRLVQTMIALWSDDVKAEGTSRVTWEIEPVGDSCRLTRHPRPAPRGRERPALRRLADDPLRPEDLARDRRAAHHARLAHVHLSVGVRSVPAPRQSESASRSVASRSGTARYHTHDAALLAARRGPRRRAP